MRNIIRIGAGTDGRRDHHTAGRRRSKPGRPHVRRVPDRHVHGPDPERHADQILNGTRISSLGVRGDTASNAWAADAIGIANAYDPSTADDIGKVYGYDDAGNIANIKMDSQARQLRNISKALAQSSRRPAAIQGGANLTTTQSTLTINVPSEGLYYITDSAGNPIMVGTKSGNANIMKNDAKDPQWRTLGTAVVKAKSMRVDKKVQVQRNGATVGKDGTASDPVGVTVGDTVTNTVEVTVPNKQAASAVKFKLIDQPKGQTYVQGSLSVRLKNAPQTDITADAIVYDGTTQNNAKSIPGDPTLKTADNRPADPDLAIPAGGWGIDGRKLLDKYSNRTIVITYRMTVDKASVTDPPTNTVHTYGTFTDGIRFTTITDQDKVDIKAYDFTLRKVDAGNVNTLVTKTPDMTPSIHLEKVDTPTLKQEGQEQADRDDPKQALKMDADSIGITFIITNTSKTDPATGDGAWYKASDLNLADSTIVGDAHVDMDSLTHPADWDTLVLKPGESVSVTGTLKGVKEGETHTDRAIVTGTPLVECAPSNGDPFNDKTDGGEDTDPEYSTGDVTEIDGKQLCADTQTTSNTDDWNGYRAKPLASTGVTVAGLAGGALAVLLAGGSLLVFRKRHYAQGSGRHTAVNAGK